MDTIRNWRIYVSEFKKPTKNIRIYKRTSRDITFNNVKTLRTEAFFIVSIFSQTIAVHLNLIFIVNYF